MNQARRLIAINQAGGAPEWIELIPAGTFSGRDGRGPYNNTDPRKVITRTHALDMDAGLPIDYDHATDFGAPEGRPAPAAGWIRELQIRDGAIWARVEWTAQGRAAVASKEYRYVSPVFERDDDGNVMRLLRAALTNNPNLHLTAISSREESTRVSKSKNTYNLTAVEIEVCRQTGLTHADYATQKTNKVAHYTSSESDLRRIAAQFGVPSIKLAVANLRRAGKLNVATASARGAGGRHVIDEMMKEAFQLQDNTAEELIAEAASILKQCAGQADSPANFKQLALAGAMIHMALDQMTPAWTALHPEAIGAPRDERYALDDPHDLAKQAHAVLAATRLNLRLPGATRAIAAAFASVRMALDGSVSINAQLTGTERTVISTLGGNGADYLRARDARRHRI